MAQVVTKREVWEGEKQQPQQQERRAQSGGDNWEPGRWRGWSSWSSSCGLASRIPGGVVLPPVSLLLSSSLPNGPVHPHTLVHKQTTSKSPACIRAGGGGNRQLKKQLNSWNGQGRKKRAETQAARGVVCETKEMLQVTRFSVLGLHSPAWGCTNNHWRVTAYTGTVTIIGLRTRIPLDCTRTITLQGASCCCFCFCFLTATSCRCKTPMQTTAAQRTAFEELPLPTHNFYLGRAKYFSASWLVTVFHYEKEDWWHRQHRCSEYTKLWVQVSAP